MKKHYFSIIFLLFFSIVSFAQKNQIKAAAIEYNSGKFQQAIDILNGAEYLIFNAEAVDQSEFYNLKAKVLTGLVENNIEPTKNVALTVTAYQELIAAEKASEKFKYSVAALESIKKIQKDLFNIALSDAKAKRFSEAASKMHTIYLTNKRDTINLYYAASYFRDAKDYNQALKLYEELDILKYSGKGLDYYAVNKQNNEDELFSSAASRDLTIKSGTHIKPRMEKSPSKKIEIYTTMAYMYLEKGDLEKSEKFNNKILEIDPKNPDSYLNLAYLKLDEKKEIMDQMSNLGTSPSDMKIYEQMIIKKDNLIKKAISYLEKGNVEIPKNQDISKLLLNLYRALDMTAAYNSLKARIVNL
jgi:tetratricopeptide (TPR) repeat protein